MWSVCGLKGFSVMIHALIRNKYVNCVVLFTKSLPKSGGKAWNSYINWAPKETYHFFRATHIKIQSIKMNHNWA